MQKKATKTFLFVFLNKKKKKKYAGEVHAFDLTQTCNMAGEYDTRCFYKLTNSDVIYQETQCDEPRIH